MTWKTNVWYNLNKIQSLRDYFSLFSNWGDSDSVFKCTVSIKNFDNVFFFQKKKANIIGKNVIMKKLNGFFVEKLFQNYSKWP